MNFLIEEQSIRITTIQLQGRVDAFNAPQLRQDARRVVDTRQARHPLGAVRLGDNTARRVHFDNKICHNGRSHANSPALTGCPLQARGGGSPI